MGNFTPQLPLPTGERENLETSCNRLEWLLLVVALVWILFAVYPEPQLDNDLSRFASAESLVERHTWVIDDSPFHFKKPRGRRPATAIVDKVKFGDHFYSTKPPVMSFLMAGEYWLFRNICGLRFADETHKPILIWMLTFTFTALPYLGIGLLFRKVSRWFIENPLVRVIGLFILLFCGEQWGFARTLNNHVPSAFFMFYSMVMAMGLVHGKVAPKPWVFLTIGLTAGLLPTFDLPGAFYCVPLFLYLLYWFPHQTLGWFAAGALPPLVLHFALTYAVTGGLIPIYMMKDLYHYEGSYWNDMQGVDALQEPKYLYFLHLSIGRKGLLMLFPVLLLAVLPQKRTAMRGLALLRERLSLSVLCFAWLILYTFQTNNYGGMAYGFRWFIFFMPSLAFFAILAIERTTTGWRWWVVCFLIAISFYSAWQCSVDPWMMNHEWPTRFLGKWTFE